MKWLITLLALFVAGKSTRADGSLYGQRIIVETNSTASAELSRWLGQMTGEKFAITNDASAGGILLLHTNSTLVAAGDVERLKNKGTEAFVIRSDGETNLWIVGNSDMAVRDGVYFYLDQLGCRWFLPNDHWTIIPRRSSISLKIDRVEAPAFRFRDLSATGGFGKGLPVDPKGEMQARWATWKSHNRLGGDIALSGHAGEGFNGTHKAELIAHPEYLAEIDGKRQPWSVTAKPCVSNPDMVKLYVDDRLALMKRGAMYVSVDPADGSGFCTCEKCRKLGSVSDQAFYLANQVAKAAAEQYPGRHVNLYAYWEHAAVPSIDLETNVYVVVVPYGLQRTGLTGEELLLAWEKKVPRLGVYDYWVLPDWSSDLPDLNFRDTVPAKIRFWHAHHVDSFMGQSGNSAGAMGIVEYVASRLLWNPAIDEKALLDDFYEKSFGAAAAPMRRMFNRWNDGFMLTGNELAYSFRDIQEARSLAKDDAVRARINDFALYVQYLRLWTEYRGAKDHKEATEALYNYLWRTYDSAMLSTFRLQQWFFFSFEKHAQWIEDEWPLKNPSAPIWATLKPVTDAEIDQFIESGVKAFVPVEYDRHNYSTKLVPLVAPAATLKTDGAWTTTPRMMGGQSYYFWAPEGMTQVELQISCGPRRASHEALFDRVTVSDPTGKQIFSLDVVTDGASRPLTIPTASAGTYRLTVMDMKLGYNLKAPADLRFDLAGGFVSIAPCPRLYFFVPKGVKRLALYAAGAIPIELLDGDGKLVGDKANGLIVKDVPAGQDGKVWSLRGFKGWTPLLPLNFPATFAFAPDALLVPEEVLK